MVIPAVAAVYDRRRFCKWPYRRRSAKRKRGSAQPKKQSAATVGIILLFAHSAFAQNPERIVYPQAIIGPFQGSTYQIELRLTNKNAFKEWTGRVRMLRSQDLLPMTSIEATDAAPVPLTDGQLQVQLGPNRSSFLKLTSATPQAGILVIESEASIIGDLLPGFWYRVIDILSGKATDLVSVQPALAASTVSSLVAARGDGIDVGIALLPERAFEAPGTPTTPVPITVTAILEDGTEITGVTSLGGTDGAQKAFFASEIIPGQPAPVRVERLIFSAREKFYMFAAAIGSLPQFANLQISPLAVTPDSSRTVALRALGAGRGLRLGAAVQARLLGEADYTRTLAREFDMVTPENEMKFGPVHPGPGTYNFTGADAIVDFALQHGMQVKGHTLVWHSQLPTWVTSRSWTRDELISVLHEHIATVVGRYKGRVSYWDVVNEAIDDSGNLRNTIWLQVIGPDYIELAFRWTREADPNAKLIYNDYGAEGLGRKSDAVYALVRGLVQKGVPIQGVGLQGHFTLSSLPKVEDVSANLARLAAIGLDAYVSELDIRVQTPASDAQLSGQAELYGAIAGACLSSSNCKAIGLWGFTDKYSWIPSTFTGYGDALIFDKQYLPKPAYMSLSDTLAK